MKTTEMKIGTKHFGPKVDITDPCYDRNVWCRINEVPIKEGTYDCLIWEAEEEILFRGKPVTNRTVAKIGIYLDGKIPDRSCFSYLGDIGVDAGLAGFFNEKPNYSPDEWKELCDSIYPLGEGCEEAWIRDDGFFSSSGEGDGCYSVLCAKDAQGEIIALEIRFL